MEKDILKKDVTKLSNKDKILFASLIVIFILIIGVCIVLIIKNSDKKEQERIEKNRNQAEAWEKSTMIDFGKAKNVDHYEYCISTDKDNKDCLWSRTTEQTLTIMMNGHRYVYYKLLDKHEKVLKENMKEIFVDSTAPIINEIELLEEEKLTIRINATDSVSSVAKYYYSMDGKEYVESTMTKVFENLDRNGSYVIYVKVEDKVGNFTAGSIEIIEGKKKTSKETDIPTPAPEPVVEENTEVQPETPNSEENTAE